jgi:hypothetical protein
MNRTTTGPGDLADVLRVLLLLQAALFLVLAIEALVFAGFFGPAAAGAAALSLAVTLGLLFARARLHRLARRGRRLLVAFEGFLLAIAALDALLAYLMADQLLGLMPALTRGVLPVVIVLLLRRLNPGSAEPAQPVLEAPLAAAAGSSAPGVSASGVSAPGVSASGVSGPATSAGGAA